MKAALHGVTPAPLPGLAGGFGDWAEPPQPMQEPHAPGPVASNRGRQQPNGGGLDFWLLDKLVRAEVAASADQVR